MLMHDVKIISPVTYYKEQAEAKKQFERVAEQIRRLWDEGTDIRIIGDKCEVPLSQVRAVLIPHIWVTPEFGLDSPSQSLQDVASTMGVSRERVRQILVENGIHERYLKQKFKDEYERQIYAEAVSQVIDRYRQGEYLGNVIADVSVSEYIVNKLHPLTDDDKREHLLSRLLGRTMVGTIPDGFDTPCREWQGAYVGKYPRAAPIDGETYVVRIMFKLIHGRGGKTVKRACKNHKCIAVEHLEEI